jgi:hypothetical protein
MIEVGKTRLTYRTYEVMQMFSQVSKMPILTKLFIVYAAQYVMYNASSMKENHIADIMARGRS